MTIQLQKLQYKYGNATAKCTIDVCNTTAKVQYPYDNTTAKSTIQVWQYNCKKYNIRMTIQLQKVQYKYDNTTAKSTIHV